MKKMNGMALLGAMAMVVCAESALANPVLFSTSDQKGNATLAAEARFREFSNFSGSNNDFEMGIWRSGSSSWFDTQNYGNSGAGYRDDNLFSLSHDGSGGLTFTMDNQNGQSYSTTASIDASSFDLNFLQIWTRYSTSRTGVASLANVTFDSGSGASTLGTGSFGGSFDFSAFSGDFNGAWTIAGNLLMSGAFSGSAEGNKIEFALGELPVIPLPGTAGMALAGMGMIGLRRRR